jgi:ATP phosphoribosyltransferase
VLSDGLILSSQAQLAASLGADWDVARLDVARRLARILEGRARARRAATLTWPPEADAAARAALQAWLEGGATPRPFGVLLAADEVFAATAAQAEHGVAPVSVTNPTYVFEAKSAAIEALAALLPPGI